MNRKARAARHIIKTRRQAEAAKRSGLRTVASHARAAGIDPIDAAGIGNAVRSKAKTLGVEGCQAHAFRRTADGARSVKGARRYTKSEVATLLAAYNPRAPKYRAAKELLVRYVGA